MSDTLCPCRSAFLAESSSIIAKVSETTRKNADARKYALGGALLKLAATDPRAYEVLKQAWAMGQKDKPRAFEDVEPLRSNEQTNVSMTEKIIRLLLQPLHEDREK